MQVRYVKICCIILALSFFNNFNVFKVFANVSSNEAEIAYRTAQSLENQKNYDKAVLLYQEVFNKFKGDIYGEEACFRIAVIYDEKLNNPVLAIENYRKYLKEYNGRNSKRAEIRLDYLSKYENADIKLYQTYISILNSDTRENRQNSKIIDNMEKFILENPKVAFLDEALLWLANEIKGFKRTAEKNEWSRIDKAIALYKRIIDEFPKSKNRLVAIKNLGDCYFLKKDLENAKKCYKQVYEDGGEAGKLLVGEYMFMTDIRNKREKIITGTVFCIPLLILGLILIVPFRFYSIKGLKRGFFHVLFFLPLGIFLTVITFFLTDTKFDNIKGTEPYFILFAMIVLAFAIIFNGIVIEAEEKNKINLILYFSDLILLILCILYSLLYKFDLLTNIERIVL